MTSDRLILFVPQFLHLSVNHIESVNPDSTTDSDWA